MSGILDKRLSRRHFLGATGATGAALMLGGSGSLALAAPKPSTDDDAPWFEATVPELQALMRSGALTSRRLTSIYLSRIERFNPLLGAVIETNPDASDRQASGRRAACRPRARAAARIPCS